MCAYLLIDQRIMVHMTLIGKAWSVFNLLNQNWTVCSLELIIPYICFNYFVVFQNSALSSMI